MKVRLIALDLDGTLLNENKQLTARSEAALTAAAERGIHIVPTTGRLFWAMPEALRKLPCIRYVIAINGGQVYDIQTDTVLVQDEIPFELAMQVYDFLESYPVSYDGYVDNRALMSRSMWDTLPDYITTDPVGLRYVTNLHTPVDDLRALLQAEQKPLQKIQAYMADLSIRPGLMKALLERFPQLAVSYSLKHNIEINTATAVKGHALKKMCDLLDIPLSEVAAFGDGCNDISMLETAGISVAMENAIPEAKAAARYRTATNNEDGVAQFIETYIL